MVPNPDRCPFCGRNDCLICWGFYTVNSKICLTGVLPVNGVVYIRRFYCKETGRTVSLLPDFLLPRKQYTNAFAGAVLEDLFDKGKRLCVVAKKYAIDYQTIQKWLRGLSCRREVKAICFARHGPLADVPEKEYARGLWMIFKKAFGGTPGGIVSAAGGLLWAEYGYPLF